MKHYKITKAFLKEIFVQAFVVVFNFGILAFVIYVFWKMYERKH